MRIGTAVTASHLPWARVLATSFAEHHPDAPPVAVLVVDDVAETVDGTGEPFTLLRPADVGIDREELHRRGAMYAPMELAGSTRALLLQELLTRGGGEPVAFIDADVLVCGPLEPVADEVRAAGIVLSPHLTGPPPAPLPLERVLLRAGTYNCGFVGVAGDAGARFAAWWAGHLERDCVNDEARGLFVSQRWLDLAPSLFDVAMLRDPGTNVTTHNLGRRAVEVADGRPTIDGAPLRLLHVGGDFDPRADAWPLLSSQPAITELGREYAARLLDAGHAAPGEGPGYGFATSADSVVLEPWVRRAVRAALLEGAPAPDPFSDGEAFTGWLAAPVGDGDLSPSRWAMALYASRPDLAAVFPYVPGADSVRYARWLNDQDTIAVPDVFAPPPVELPEERAGRERESYVTSLNDQLAAARADVDAARADASAARAAADRAERSATDLAGVLDQAEQDRDAAIRALDLLRTSHLFRLTRAPRRAWYRLRGGSRSSG
jgi:hypothetical protein